MVRNARGAPRRERKVILSYGRCYRSILLRPFVRCMKLRDRVTLRSRGDSPVVPMTVALVVAAGFRGPAVAGCCAPAVGRIAVSAATSLRSAPFEFRVLWCVSMLLVLSAAAGIWLGDVGFRSLDDAYLLSWLVLLYRRGRIWPWSMICFATWGVVFVELVRSV